MRVLGIDPALQRTGWGVIDFDGRSVSLVDAGVIQTSASETMSKRLASIYRQMQSVIVSFKPERAVLEKVFVHYHHVTTAFFLGQARGVICLACEENGVALTEYAATEVKKAIVGQGMASKDQVQRMVIKLLSMRSVPAYSDITDALALALAYRFMSRTDSVLSAVLASGRKRK